MPQCIIRYHEEYLSAEKVRRIGELVRPLVAVAASTDQVPLTAEDVEWIPEPYRPGASGVPDVAIELRTIGFRYRKNKLDREGALALREQIIAVPGFPYVNPTALLLWIQFYDPDGVHV